MKRGLTAVVAFATVAIMSYVGSAYAGGGENSAMEMRRFPEARQTSNNATAQAPAGATISDIDSDGVFGCQHLDEARRAGPPEQLRDVDLRSGECTRFARGEHVYTVHKAWSSTQTDPDGRRISPSLYTVQRVGGGPTYYVVGD